MPYSKDLPPEKMRTPQVVELTGIWRTTIWRMEQAGKFPKGEKMPGWGKVYDRRAVMDWMEARGANKPGGAASALVASLEALVETYGLERVTKALALLQPWQS